MVSFLMAEHQWGMTFDPPLGAPGYTRMMNRRPYRTRDGYIALLPYLDAHWNTFCRLAGRPDLLEDARFASLASRLKHITETYAETEKIVATRTTQEWLDLFAGTSIPTVVVNRLEDLADDPHLNAVGFWSFVEHPSEGRLRAPAFPVNFGATPADIRRHAPRMGEHTVEVLREAGLSAAEIDALCASGAALTAKQVTRKPGQDEASA
jgi:crotonobetainyl-CoA:carnitine CoA-transferase CaiB-like acyl-CoA transferase